MSMQWVDGALQGIDQEIAVHEQRISELREIRARLSSDRSDSAAPTTSGPRDAMKKKGGRRVGRQLSPEARARLSESMKKRWSKRKRAGANSLAD